MRGARDSFRPERRKEYFLDSCRAFVRDLDELLGGKSIDRLDPEWWNEVSSLLRAALGQDPLISRGFESARALFFRAGARAEPRKIALSELRETLQQAAARIESLPSAGPAGWHDDRKTA